MHSGNPYVPSMDSPKPLMGVGCGIHERELNVDVEENLVPQGLIGYNAVEALAICIIFMLLFEIFE